jgi:hypothetical protein
VKHLFKTNVWLPGSGEEWRESLVIARANRSYQSYTTDMPYCDYSDPLLLLNPQSLPSSAGYRQKAGMLQTALGSYRKYFHLETLGDSDRAQPVSTGDLI